jgi:hypothetical protein
VDFRLSALVEIPPLPEDFELSSFAMTGRSGFFLEGAFDFSLGIAGFLASTPLITVVWL